jgi:CHAT domain-containing protein
LARRAQLRLQALHALVWAPLADHLTDARRLLLVPCAGLTGLPFAALHDGLTSLAQRHLLAEAPSLRVALMGLQRPPVAARRLLALGESSRLTHAGQEAEAVAALFADGQAFVGADATLATLRLHAGSADVLHLACHAQFRADNPMFSALHLADGPLTAERAEALALRPGVVVLSACDTGLAGQTGGDEQVGLVRAFLVAGASRVLASLWPVDDAVTAAFMARFYRELQQGRTPTEALAEAQAGLMVQHPHPAFWSGFVMFGGW